MLAARQPPAVAVAEKPLDKDFDLVAVGFEAHDIAPGIAGALVAQPVTPGGGGAGVFHAR